MFEYIETTPGRRQYIYNCIKKYDVNRFLTKLYEDDNFYEEILKKITYNELMNSLYLLNSSIKFEYLLKFMEKYNLKVNTYLFPIFKRNVLTLYKDWNNLNCKKFISYTLNTIKYQEESFLELIYKTFYSQFTNRQRTKIEFYLIDRGLINSAKLLPESACRKTIYDLQGITPIKYIQDINNDIEALDVDKIIDWNLFFDNINCHFNQYTCHKIFNKIIDKDLKIFKYSGKFRRMINIVMYNARQSDIDKLYTKFLSNTKAKKLKIMVRDPINIDENLYEKYRQMRKEG